MNSIKNFEILIRDEFKKQIKLDQTNNLFQKHSITNGNIEEELKKLFLSLLQSENCAELDLKTLFDHKRQLIFDFLLEQKQLDIYFDFISYVIDIGRNIKVISFEEIELWKKLVELFSDMSKIRSLNFFRNHHNREEMLSEQIKYLRKYKIKTKNGSPDISDKKKLYRIENEIEKLIKEVGGLRVINYIFSLLKSDYSSIFDRYLFPIKYLPVGGIAKILIPTNYILMLAIKNINLSNVVSKHEKKYFQKILKLSTALVSLYDVHPNSIYDNMNGMSLETIYNKILFDHAYRFQQLTLDELVWLLQNIFDASVFVEIEQKLGFSIQEYITLVKKIYAFNTQILDSNLFNIKECQILDKISHQNAINEAYVLPDEYDKVINPFFIKSLIKKDKNYIFLHPTYCAFGFYEAVASLLRNNYEQVDNKLGQEFEEVVRKLAILQNYTLHYGKYDNKKEECDLVLETDEAILFFEFKKKGITRKSVDGDSLEIIIDIGESLLKALQQANKHDLYLQQNKQIVFETGSQTTLLLNDRKTEKIFVSVYDFMSLGTHDFVTYFINWIVQVQINISDESKMEVKKRQKIEKINKLIENTRDYMNHLEVDNPNGYRKKWLDVWCLPYALLYFLLKNSTSKTFYENFKISKHMVHSTGDIFAEYHHAMKVKKWQT